MYRGQWNPPVDEVIHKNYFNSGKGFFIECGAGLSGESCSFFEDVQGWDGVYVEASKYAYRELVINRPNSTTVHAGLSNVIGKRHFTDIVSAPGGGHGNGSLAHTSSHLNILNEYGCKFEQYEVQTLTYTALLNQLNVDSVDLMVLDVEGHELDVLSGMISCSDKLKPSVMCIEYPIVGLKVLVSFMDSLGYLYDFVSFNNAYFHLNTFQVISSKWFGSTHPMKDINK